MGEGGGPTYPPPDHRPPSPRCPLESLMHPHGAPATRLDACDSDEPVRLEGTVGTRRSGWGSEGQGARRTMLHGPSTEPRVYRTRSWRRLGRPCHSSTMSGARRQPPQNAGRGIWSTAAKVDSNWATLASSAARSGNGWDCGEAHAPICEPRGRVAKYSSLSTSVACSTVPTTRSWRCSCSHVNSIEALPVASSSALLADS